MSPVRPIVMGSVAGVSGLRGWVKVLSFTEPRSNLFDYDTLWLGRASAPNGQDGGWRAFEVSGGRPQGKGMVLKFVGIDDRDAAAALIGLDIAVDRERLPPLEEGEFYWADLEGLRVVTGEGVGLGRVERLFATGANDVLVARDEDGRERLLPFLRGQVIKTVDLGQGLIEVDWDPDF